MSCETRTHLDLFSGIGGFALAAQWTGWTTIGFSEIDPYACRVLAKHWPNVPNYGDIRNVHGIKCDLITGGFPCQPYSIAGKRRGARDDRALWPEMRRVIAESKPRWVLGENVPGIINMELDSALSDLEALGYSCWPLVIPACAVDARHRRNRVWIVAHADESGLQGWDDEKLRECAIQRAVGSRDSFLVNPNSTGFWDNSKLPAWSGQQGKGERNNRTVTNPSRWLPEPELGRVANGIPHRVDRLKGLGNAIVPQVAAEIMRHML